MEKNRNREAGNDGTKFPLLPKKKKNNNENKTKFEKKVNLRKSTYENISLNKMTVCTVTTPFSLDMFVVPS